MRLLQEILLPRNMEIISPDEIELLQKKSSEIRRSRCNALYGIYLSLDQIAQMALFKIVATKKQYYSNEK